MPQVIPWLLEKRVLVSVKNEKRFQKDDENKDGLDEDECTMLLKAILDIFV